MSKFIIQGQTKLKGNISVKGAKNNALKIIPAALLTKEKVIIHNVPDILDVNLSLEILKSLGAKVKKIGKSSYEIEAKKIDPKKINTDLTKRIRASLMFIAPLLHRVKEIEIPHPGGCVIGKRPIDFFIDFFQILGTKVKEQKDSYKFINQGLKGARYIFERISHTGTESLMLAAVLAQGKTEIINAACEPEVEALADFLNSMGAKVKGAGSPYITIEGVKKL
ncbi:UDP-N-acetylglucosamine 1-carboxyvinyltransferase, partial [bacterium]|nr:UDP-N-acetylglucosamine 1-carboxyvinyltransferase [bacterium]